MSYKAFKLISYKTIHQIYSTAIYLGNDKLSITSQSHQVMHM
uniref:Uncharacterized protein n=1 Tax=Arundo donax TaxID=35708 RepID=A0A0A9D5S1_ARUDO